jgi:hypothetical protein
MFKGKDGEIHNVKCVVCSIVTRKDLILCPKLNTFDKHVNKKNVTKVLSHLGVKKYEWFVSKRCQHLKNVIMYMSKVTTH